MTGFEAIYEEYFIHVYRYIYSMCENENLAEEISQETFYKALEHMNQFDGKSRLYVWLCSIAKNTYFAWFNEQKKKMEIPDSLEDASADISEMFEQKDLADRAFSCLHSLEEPYKEVFMLYVFGGLSLKAISSLFSKSESWARVTYYRAKQKIMEGLAKDEL